MRFSDDKYKSTMYITTTFKWDAEPINIKVPTTDYYDRGFTQWLSIEDAEKLVEYLGRAIVKAKLLVEEEVDE